MNKITTICLSLAASFGLSTSLFAHTKNDAGEVKHSTEIAAVQSDFTIGNGTFLLNGKPFVVKAAELHYPRIPRPYWEQRIQLCKALA